jgi:hypothetical protein
MALKPRIYNDLQRQALLTAVVLDGLTIAEAQRRAIAGELPGTPAFNIKYNSAADIVRRGREAFEIRALRDPEHARKTLDADALLVCGYAHLATKAIEKAVKAGETPDAATVRKAADAITSARRALGPAPRKPAPKPEPETPHDKPVNGVLAELINLATSNSAHANGAQTESPAA